MCRCMSAGKSEALHGNALIMGAVGSTLGELVPSAYGAATSLPSMQGGHLPPMAQAHHHRGRDLYGYAGMTHEPVAYESEPEPPK
jgi:hypothetical protein